MTNKVKIIISQKTFFFFTGDSENSENNEKTRQNAESKPTFDWGDRSESKRLKLTGKTRQTAENKQPFLFDGKN